MQIQRQHTAHTTQSSCNVIPATSRQAPSSSLLHFEHVWAGPFFNKEATGSSINNILKKNKAKTKACVCGCVCVCVCVCVHRFSPFFLVYFDIFALLTFFFPSPFLLHTWSDPMQVLHTIFPWFSKISLSFMLHEQTPHLKHFWSKWYQIESVTCKEEFQVDDCFVAVWLYLFFQNFEMRSNFYFIFKSTERFFSPFFL